MFQNTRHNDPLRLQHPVQGTNSQSELDAVLDRALEVVKPVAMTERVGIRREGQARVAAATISG